MSGALDKLRGVRALVRVGRAGAAGYGVSALAVARLARRARRRGFEYDEALRLGLLDPALPQERRAALVSRHANLEAQARLNGGNDVPALTGDKSAFYRYCAAIGVPTPSLLAIIDRRASGWGTSGRIITSRADWEALVEDDLPDEFVVKPSEGYAGRGVRIARRSDAREIWEAMRADPEFDVWVVQQRLVNHPQIAAVGGDAALHTVRVATLVRRDGAAEPLFAFLKLAIGGGPSDNFLGGATGNAVAGVDVRDGAVGALVVPRRDGLGLVEHATSPMTGARVEGMMLPAWDEILRIVTDAAPAFLPWRALGWDVALTPEGPVVVEVNTRWLPFPGPVMHDVHRRLASAA